MSTYRGIPCVHEVRACFNGKDHFQYLNFSLRWSRAFMSQDQIPEGIELPRNLDDLKDEDLAKEIESIIDQENAIESDCEDNKDRDLGNNIQNPPVKEKRKRKKQMKVKNSIVAIRLREILKEPRKIKKHATIFCIIYNI